MNRKTLNLFALIFILAFLATILVVWQLFLAPRQAKPSPPTILPTPSPAVSSPTPTETGGRGDPLEKLTIDLSQEFPLLDFTPYQEIDFSLEYAGPRFLKVTLKQDTPQIKEKVFNWIKEKGVDPQTHEIKWVTP